MGQSSRSRMHRSRFFAIFKFLAPQKIIRGGGASPHLGMALKTPFSPLSFGKSFMKIRSAGADFHLT